MTLTKSVHKIKYGEELKLVPIGDIHEGQIGMDEAALDFAIADIKKTGAVCILMGDLIDAICPNGDKRFNPKELSRRYTVEDLEDLPRMQADRIVELFEPIKSQIVTYVSGNHEDAFTKYHGFNPAKYIARRLDIPLIKYIGFHTLNVDVGGHVGNVKIFLNHGKGGGGKTAGNAKNKLDDLTRHFDFDIALIGHTHKMETLHNSRVGLNNTGTGIKRAKSLVVNTGTFLRTYGEYDNYFAANGGRESDVGYYKIGIKMSNSPGPWETHYRVEEVRL